MILMLVLVAGLGVPAIAQENRENAKQQVVRGLVNIVKQQVEKRRQTKASKDAADPATDNAAAPAAPTLVQILEETLAPQLDEVKEHYKEQGRAYARQVGDLIAERILASPRVQRVLRMMEVLAGVLAAYLTLVTFKLLVGIRAVRRENAQILKLLEERKRER